MDAWNREQLYSDVWEQPLVKLTSKYGVSAVMLGKVCKKLKIPVPGRGYWAKKEFGKPVERLPLPEAKDLPVVERFKEPEPPAAAVADATPPPPEPSDPEYLRIKEVESCPFGVNLDAKLHKSVIASERMLRHAHVDGKGIINAGWDCLDINVSKASLDRALLIMNAVIIALEAEKFPVTLVREKHNTRASIFDHVVPFAIVEKYREKSRREATGSTGQRYIIEYEPTGILEFQVGTDRWGKTRVRDGKKQRLEEMLSQIVGTLMREGRERLIQAEVTKQREIERRKKEIEHDELRKKIAAEEQKVTQLNEWVSAWKKAREMREFITALEQLWTEQGFDLSAESEKGKRITWMKQQADRLDPMRESPPSILDRKGELHQYF